MADPPDKSLLQWSTSAHEEPRSRRTIEDCCAEMLEAMHAAESIAIFERNDQESPLLRLIGELRNKIYRYAVVPEEPIRLQIAQHKGRSQITNDALPPLARVSRRLHNEVAPIYFAENVFRIDVSGCLDGDCDVALRLDQISSSRRVLGHAANRIKMLTLRSCDIFDLYEVDGAVFFGLWLHDDLCPGGTSHNFDVPSMMYHFKLDQLTHRSIAKLCSCDLAQQVLLSRIRGTASLLDVAEAYVSKNMNREKGMPKRPHFINTFATAGMDLVSWGDEWDGYSRCHRCRGLLEWSRGFQFE